MPLHVQYDFYPYQGYLCAFALLFSKPPPQRNYLPNTVPGSVSRSHKLDLSNLTSGIPLTAGLRRASRLSSTIKRNKSVSSCSKAPRGLLVLQSTGRIFTAISISPDQWSRQSSSRCSFHARRNLLDKVLRYHRHLFITVLRKILSLYVSIQIGLYHVRSY